jgi:DNA-directed RNA polymerase subunit beta'
VEVEEGRFIKAGTIIAKTPKEARGTQDITGGLPRVTELLEARMPKSPSVISEIDGVVELGEKRRGKRVITVRSESGMVREHLVPAGKHILVHRGDSVRAGDPLVDGPLVLHDILRIKGAESAHQYILREVQTVYRTFGVMINDKHVEIIISRMMRKVQVVDAGDSRMLPGLTVDKFRFDDFRKQALAEGGKPPSAEPVLQGITKSALGSESFLSAASFQDTTKVFTEAALAGKVDHLVGLKENVILGNLIPVGTGFRAYHDARLRHKMVVPEEETTESDEVTVAAS